MYMLVFVTLVVALIGTYAQIYTKQAARMFSQQSGIAETMMAWNATAVSLANNLVTASSVTTPGVCGLTDLTGLVGIPTVSYCQRTATNVFVGNPSTYGGLFLCSRSQTAPCRTDLPPGYQAGAYPFYSIAFTTGTPVQNYVLTFVPPPVTSGQALPGLDLLCLPGVASGTFTICPGNQKQMSITFSELYRQLRKNPNASPMYYGVVNASHQLITPTITFGDLSTPTALTYTVPNLVPTGSIGIITLVSLCSTC